MMRDPGRSHLLSSPSRQLSTPSKPFYVSFVGCLTSQTSASSLFLVVYFKFPNSRGRCLAHLGTWSKQLRW